MSLTKPLIERALTTVDLPGQGDPITSGALQWVSACDSYAAIKLSVQGDHDRTTLMQIAGECDQAVRREAKAAGASVTSLQVEFVDHAGQTVFKTGRGPDDAPPADAPNPAAKPTQQAPQQTTQQAEAKPTGSPLPGVKHIIAVGAGKGGVGKSTISVNLAVGLARQGHAVGLLDGDIYGPSLPTMLGLTALDQNVLGGQLQPFAVHGIKAVTIGKMVDPEKPLIWRGPMAHGAFNQLTSRTNWGELDYLVIDLPPGTGDIPLTMAQSLQLTGAVIVCTPQKVAQDDAVRAARMFGQLGVDVLGVVENMSYFIGDPDEQGRTKIYDLFGRGGAEMMAQRLGLPFLGGVPINTALRVNSDSGDPSANFDTAKAGGDSLPKSLETLVKNLESQVALASMRQGATRPTLSIS